ncbi:MAG TPA: hypothetical protein VMS22_16020 [Candidatus Eisenbacteria bacterium]|nr:hypothetical protein [Candidatus Eisenbacteria bacterium]
MTQRLATVLIFLAGALLFIASAGRSDAACVGGAPNGLLEGSEQCDTGAATNRCCTNTCTYQASGTACDDFNDCSKNTKCDDDGDCGGGTKEADGTPCRDKDINGNNIDCVQRSCQAKACTGSGTDMCSDGIRCTDDICLNPNTTTCQSTHPASAVNTPCDLDGNQCTVDRCNGTAGGCYNVTTISCPNTNPGVCKFDACDTASGACVVNNKDQGTACTSDSNTCTDDECNKTGACKHFNRGAGAPCDDANSCTSGEQCDAHKNCGGNGPPYAGNPIANGTACASDGSVCTFDYCTGAPSSPTCSHTNVSFDGLSNTNGTTCNDTNICTDASSCSGGSCVGTHCATGTCPYCSSACGTTTPSCGCGAGTGG